MGATYKDQDGEEKPLVMGSYGIGIGRLIACIAEEYHDEQGLTWPVTVAPYPVHLIRLAGKGTEISNTAKLADQIYDTLTRAGLEPLYDDREESPGVKFNDADLIGLPVRITVSERALKAGGVELKLRRQGEKEIVPLDAVVERVKFEITRMEDEIQVGVKEAAYA
jgi:prolyl-tRNA synthetase